MTRKLHKYIDLCKQGLFVIRIDIAEFSLILIYPFKDSALGNTTTWHELIINPHRC